MAKIIKISFIKYLIFMKLVIVFMLIVIVNVNASISAQTITSSKKNVPIATIFKEVKKQTHYNLICDISIIRETSHMDVNVKNKPLDEFLDEILSKRNLTYVVNDKTIV